MGTRGYVSGSTFFGEGLPMYTFYMKKLCRGLGRGPVDVVHGRNSTARSNPDGHAASRRPNMPRPSDYLCGDPIPDLYGGFGTSVNFRGFDLNSAWPSPIRSAVWPTIRDTAAAMYSPANKIDGS